MSHDKYHSSYTDYEVDKAKAKLAYIVRDVEHSEIVYIRDSGGGYWLTEVGGYDIAVGVAAVDEGNTGFSVFDKDTGDHLSEYYTICAWKIAKNHIEENYG